MSAYNKFPIHILLENVRSAFNVGSMFRTCDTAGVTKLWLTGITAYPPHNKVLKTALGSTESVEWEHANDSVTIINQLKEQGVTPVAAEITKEALGYTKYEYPKPVVIVLGNEIAGVSEEILELCENHVMIPMHGTKTSLNVEVTCGIILYEIIRQYTLQDAD